jgi:hypothetical protein
MENETFNTGECGGFDRTIDWPRTASVKRLFSWFSCGQRAPLSDTVTSVFTLDETEMRLD